MKHSVCALMCIEKEFCLGKFKDHMNCEKSIKMLIGHGKQLSIEASLVQLLFKIELYLTNTHTSIHFNKKKRISPVKKKYCYIVIWTKKILFE